MSVVVASPRFLATGLFVGAVGMPPHREGHQSRQIHAEGQVAMFAPTEAFAVEPGQEPLHPKAQGSLVLERLQ